MVSKIREIKKGEKFCVIELEFNVNSINSVLVFFKHQIADSNIINHIFYYENKGKAWNVADLYNYNKSSRGRFDRSKDFIVSCSETQKVSSYIIEAKCLNEDDNEQTLQYLCCLVKYVQSRYRNVMISVLLYKQSDENIYGYFKEYNYRFRCCLSLLNIVDEDLVGAFYHYYQYKVGDNPCWYKLVADKKINIDGEVIIKKEYVNAGRILPFIPIDEESYKSLSKSYVNADDALKELVNTYKERIISSKFEKIYEKAKVFENSDTILDSLIFISSLFYIFIFDKKERDFNYPSEKEVYRLHEICCDYSQSLAQLIENAYYYAVRKSDGDAFEGNSINGCANFAMRIRRREDSKYAKEGTFSNDYFIEFYVTDLQYDSFKCIKGRFLDNVKKRDSLNNTKYYEPLRQTIKLGDLFTGNNDNLQKYLSDPRNVAFHYGLQILNNTISVAKGFLYVRSGEDYSNYLEQTQEKQLQGKTEGKDVQISLFEDMQEEDLPISINDKYYFDGFHWSDGTAYVFFLPMKINEDTSHGDIIATNNEGSPDPKPEQVLYNYLPEKTISGLEDKLVCVKEIKTRIKNDIDSLKEELASEAIIFIDCYKWKKEYYESLARAVFLYLASEENKTVKNFALINFSDRQDVIKLFRQFALFYNRDGINVHMRGRCVYLVDKNANLDILLQDDLTKMDSDLYESQINGGLDDLSMEILKIIAHCRRG